MNPVLRLVHAVRLDPYPSISEWRRLQALARTALAEHDEALLRAGNAERELAKMRRETPKFQGMTELA